MVGNRIRECRERLGISQVELARRIRIASPNLSNIENGRLAPWPKARRDLSKVLKVPQKMLFPREPTDAE